jgi:predicted PurR-regulated permease PerM
LQPFIMSRSVKVHPLAIVLAVIAGTTLKGIPGALISVPLVAFINTAVKALQHGPDDAADTMKQQVDREIDEQNLEADDKESVRRHAAT